MQSPLSAPSRPGHVPAVEQVDEVVIRGCTARFIQALAAWMNWQPADLAVALMAVSLEGFEASSPLDLVEALFNTRARYDTGNIPLAWREQWLNEKNGGAK